MTNKGNTYDRLYWVMSDQSGANDRQRKSYRVLFFGILRQTRPDESRVLISIVERDDGRNCAELLSTLASTRDINLHDRRCSVILVSFNVYK